MESPSAVGAGFVEAGGCLLIGRCACAKGGCRDMRPAAHLLFLRRQEKKAKEGDPQSATPALRYGANLRRGGCGVRRGTRFAAAQRRSDSHGESDHEARALRRACHPTTAPPQAQPAGGEHPNSHSGRRCARPGQSCAQRVALAPAKWGRAQRRPEWMFAPHPLCMRRGAQRPADQGSRLSERSAAQRVRARPRWTRAPQVARSEAQGRRQWGRLFFGDFLLAKQKKVTAPPGALPGSRPMQRHEAKSASKAYRKSATSYKNRSTHHTAPRRARHRCAHPSNVK